ncbi:MAG: glycosyltransferase family 2 protein [Clostridia bacterium]|nr:glycosyltransferase family 2 protein [Clostridia bacterium]
MLNIVVPMAGRGSRFANAGYKLPKPLIEIHGHPMIEYVIRDITPSCPHRFIFLCLQDHLEKYDLASFLETAAPGCVVVPVDQVTQGAACTVLLAEKWINTDDPLMIANSDQFVETDIDAYLAAMGDDDGLIMTLYANDTKWSYIKFDEERHVTLVREKEVISNEATVGIYNYRHGSDFVKYAHQMIDREIRVNGEFYVAPVYNEMIEAGKKITFLNIGEKMHGLGVPDDLEAFIRNPVSRTVFGA